MSFISIAVGIAKSQAKGREERRQHLPESVPQHLSLRVNNVHACQARRGGARVGWGGVVGG